MIPKNPRGRPMTTDFGNWTNGVRNGYVELLFGAEYGRRLLSHFHSPRSYSEDQPGNSAESNPQSAESDATPTKRRRLSSELDGLDGGVQSSGPVCSARSKLPAFSTQAGPGVRYPTNGQEVMREGDSYATSNARSSQIPIVPAKASIQVTGDLHSAQPNGFGRTSTSNFQEVPHIFAVPQILATTPGNSSITKDTPSSIQAASAAAGSSAATGSTPGSGPAQSGQPRHFFNYRSDTDFSMQLNVRDVSLVCAVIRFSGKVLKVFVCSQ